MRSHSNEHSDSLPVLDISALKHVAYVLDALIYYMRSDTINAPLPTTTVSAFNDVDNESWVADQVAFKFHAFLLRILVFRTDTYFTSMVGPCF